MNLKFFKLLLKIVSVFFLLLSAVLLGFTDYAFAEDLISPEPEKPVDKPENLSKDTKSSYLDMLWAYRWYLLGASGLILLGFAAYFSMSVAPPTIPPMPGAGAMPIVPGQTITDLLLLRPDVHMDPKVTALMPDMLSVDSNFKHPLEAPVLDHNFIKGFRVGDQLFQVYLMPNTAYDDLSQAFWIQEAQNVLGKVTFSDPTLTFLYTKLAVIPLDTITYTVYHKVDIVHVIADPGHTSVPVIKASFLFKDNEIAFVQ